MNSNILTNLIEVFPTYEFVKKNGYYWIFNKNQFFVDRIETEILESRQMPDVKKSLLFDPYFPVILKVYEYYKKNPSDFWEKGKNGDRSKYRQICYYILVRYLSASLWSVARFGRRDSHQTIFHGVRKVENDMSIYPDFRLEISKLVQMIKLGTYE